MRQLLIRLDDDLYARLAALAGAESKPLHGFVVEALREHLRLVQPEPPWSPPIPERQHPVITGTGHAVSEALEADRGEW